MFSFDPFPKSLLGKHRLCATIRFLVFSLIVDFDGVLVVVLVVLVTFGPLTP